MKKKKKYNIWLGDDNYSAENCFSASSLESNHPTPAWNNTPSQIRLDVYSSGICFGYIMSDSSNYIGIPQGAEGNILILGGCGSGKSAGIAKPTLYTWQGTMCVTDIKGELSDFYKTLYEQGLVKRPFKVFDPMNVDGIGYDPFYRLYQHNDYDLINEVREMAFILIPSPPDVKEPFWIESERSILAAAIFYNVRLGLSFSETMLNITQSSVNVLIQKIQASGNTYAKMILGDTTNLKPETLAAFDREIRNKLIVFSTDPHIINAFRDARKDPDCFTWDDLDTYNIFLRIPAEMIEQWGGVMNLMYTQLIHHLERRPDIYTSKGAQNIQTLLLMDEFARFGRLEMITNAMATLRSKNVNICLFLQSLAQLDKIYGTYDRRIILDNCQFKAILNANDAETQQYFSSLIGTHINIQHGHSRSYDDFYNYSKTEQFNETREYIIFPHELSTLTDILLLTPYGFCRIDKLQFHNNLSHCPLLPEPMMIINATARRVIDQPLFQQQCNESQQDVEYTIVANEDIHVDAVYHSGY